MSKADKCVKGFPCKLSCIPRTNNCLGGVSSRNSAILKQFSKIIEKIGIKDDGKIDYNKIEKSDKSKFLYLLKITGNTGILNFSNAAEEDDFNNELKNAEEKYSKRGKVKFNPAGEIAFKDKIGKLEEILSDEKYNIIPDLLQKIKNKSKLSTEESALLKEYNSTSYKYNSLVNAYLNVRLSPARKNRKDEISPDGYTNYKKLNELEKDQGKKQLSNVLPDDQLAKKEKELTAAEKEKPGIDPNENKNWLQNRQNNIAKISLEELYGEGIELPFDVIPDVEGLFDEEDIDILSNILSGMNMNNGDPNSPAYSGFDEKGVPLTDGKDIRKRYRDVVLKNYLKQNGRDIHDGSPMNIDEVSVEHIIPNSRPDRIKRELDKDGNIILSSDKSGEKIVIPAGTTPAEVKKILQAYLDSPYNTGLSREKINKIKSDKGGGVLHREILKRNRFDIEKLPDIIDNIGVKEASYRKSIIDNIKKFQSLDKLTDEQINKLVKKINDLTNKPLRGIRELTEAINLDDSLTDVEKKVLNKSIGAEFLIRHEKALGSYKYNYKEEDSILDVGDKDTYLDFANNLLLNPPFYEKDIDINEGIEELKDDEGNIIDSIELENFFNNLVVGKKLNRGTEDNEAARQILKAMGMEVGFSPNRLDKEWINYLSAKKLNPKLEAPRRNAVDLKITFKDIFSKIMSSNASIERKLKLAEDLTKYKAAILGGKGSLREKIEGRNFEEFFTDGSNQLEVLKEMEEHRNILLDVTTNVFNDILNNPSQLDNLKSIPESDKVNLSIDSNTKSKYLETLEMLKSGDYSSLNIGNIQVLAALVGYDSPMVIFLYNKLEAPLPTETSAQAPIQQPTPNTESIPGTPTVQIAEPQPLTFPKQKRAQKLTTQSAQPKKN